MYRQLVATFAVLVLAGSAGAAEEVRPMPPAKHHPNIAARLDTDGDGHVSREEFIAGVQKHEAWIKANRPELYRRLDVDGDGALTGKDRHALHERWQQRRAGLRDRLDRNDDGKVGPGERRAADRREDVRDRREDVRDRREDVRDHREDVRDRAEDRRDAAHDGGLIDDLEDIFDRREDVRDGREDVRDRREDARDRREDARDRRPVGRDRQSR